jgi:4-hydroxy-tetrahydrodipicolinate synthase
MQRAKFHGTITAIITPFRGGEVDFAALEKLVEMQISSGVSGLVPCGTTGESPTLTEVEHHAVIDQTVRFVRGRVPVIAGVGSNSTTVTIERAKHAEQAGATGLLVVSPYYNRPSQEGLYQHFSMVARATPLPIMLYNIPGRCGVEISIQTLCRLYEDNPTIVSVKHATGRVDDAAELISVCPIDVISGDDPITWPLMAVGAVGVVSVMSNLIPASVAALTRAALARDFGGAFSAHRAMYGLTRGLLSLDVNPVPIKTALAIRGMCSDELRLPLAPLPLDRRQKLTALLAESNLT